MTVTIFGSNFGQNESDIVGRLLTDDGKMLQCSPLILVSDAQVKCNLTARSGESMRGNLELVAGTYWSGGSQATSRTANTVLLELEQPVLVYITLAIDIATIPQNTFDRDAFIRAFVTQTAAALRVPTRRIEVVDILPGSIVVVVRLLPDPSISSPTPLELAALLLLLISDPSSNFRASTVTGTVLGFAASGFQTFSVPPAGTAAGASAGLAAPGGSGGAMRGTRQAGSAEEFVLRCKRRGEERCFNCCVDACEAKADGPRVSGKAVAARFRGRLCRELCFDGCGSRGPQPH